MCLSFEVIHGVIKPATTKKRFWIKQQTKYILLVLQQLLHPLIGHHPALQNDTLIAWTPPSPSELHPLIGNHPALQNDTLTAWTPPSLSELHPLVGNHPALQNYLLNVWTPPSPAFPGLTAQISGHRSTVVNPLNADLLTPLIANLLIPLIADLLSPLIADLAAGQPGCYATQQSPQTRGVLTDP